ncbi:MAG: energy transducer TonB [Flavobacteriales bacterium]|nr:energy transducer TonB [Flavobacteriales bacterium]
MKNLLFLLAIILFTNCVSKKKYQELLVRNCDVESENLLRNLSNGDPNISLSKWKSMDKDCGETSENYYLSGALIYKYLSYKNRRTNSELVERYEDSSINLFKIGIAKLDSTPTLKLNYAMSLRERNNISNIEFYTLVRDAIYCDNKKIKDHVVSQFFESAKEASVNNKVPKSQLSFDFFQLLKIESRKNTWQTNQSDRYMEDAHLFLDCENLTIELKLLNKNFGYNFHAIKFYLKAYNKLNCSEDLEINKMNNKVKKEEEREKTVRIDNYRTKAPRVEEIFEVVETQPSFPGGEEELFKFIRQNTVYPDSAKENGINGKVYVQFVVTKTGEVNDIKVIRGIGGGCDEAAVAVVSKMPNWIPGEQRGKKIDVRFVLPISFKLE